MCCSVLYLWNIVFSVLVNINSVELYPDCTFIFLLSVSHAGVFICLWPYGHYMQCLVSLELIPGSPLSQHNWWWCLLVLHRTGSPPLIGLKEVHLDSASLVIGRVYVSIVWAWRLIKSAAFGQSPSLWNGFGTQFLSRSVAFFGKQTIDAERNSPLARQLTWFQIPLLLLPWKSVAYVQ